MKPRLFGQSYAFQGFWTPINEITHREYPIDLFIEVYIQELIHELIIATMKVTNNKISALGVSVVLMMNRGHGLLLHGWSLKWILWYYSPDIQPSPWSTDNTTGKSFIDSRNAIYL
jgi:hypothetical protein